MNNTIFNRRTDMNEKASDRKIINLYLDRSGALYGAPFGPS